jgi:hypothetical protein
VIWPGRRKAEATNWQGDDTGGGAVRHSRLEVNAMRVLVGKNGLNQQEGTEAAAEGSVRMLLILSFSILGVAVAYFGLLYLIAR